MYINLLSGNIDVVVSYFCGKVFIAINLPWEAQLIDKYLNAKLSKKWQWCS
jgi:hypothetical protein